MVHVRELPIFGVCQEHFFSIKGVHAGTSGGRALLMVNPGPEAGTQSKISHEPVGTACGGMKPLLTERER